jgi:hypothetical protein
MMRTRFRAFLLRLTILGLGAIGTGCDGGAASGGSTAPDGGTASSENFPMDPAPAVSGPAWWGFGRDPQHGAVGAIASQDLGRIVWRKRIDMAPTYDSSGGLPIHYGSPVITDENTVVLPVKTIWSGGFQIQARSGGNGALIWSADSDYLPPKTVFMPGYNLTLSATGRLYAPGAGGKLLWRDAPDSSTGEIQTAVFYGADVYAAAASTYDASVVINTPITVDAQGTAFFGFWVTGDNPAGLVSGIARVAADGTGTWRGASDAAGDPVIQKVGTSSGPALSPDGQTLYVAVNGDAPQTGKLLALDSLTLSTLQVQLLVDPSTGENADVDDNSSASPAVGPDGDVYIGVLEPKGVSHNGRGWMLHFDGTLATLKTPGSFGWDDTASMIPASMVPTYAGTSPYLLLTKYNNYKAPGVGGDGQNRIAVIDPNATQPDAFSSVTVMKEVLTILGPTPDPDVPGGVKEWCINSGAVDPLTHSVLVTSEDGVLYRWDLATNQLSQQIRLTDGLGQAYTPTAIGADGAVYAIASSTLFVVAQ